MAEPDPATRTRVLDAATRLFAASGYQKVTVRTICRDAGANISAVNYHFGDKLGLYREVLGRAVEAMRATTDAARRAGDGLTADQRLRAYIRVFLQRVVGQAHDSWIHQLMAHEMADPTPALDLVIDEVLRPRIAFLGELVAEVLQVPRDDARVLRCVLSVQSQFHALMMNPVSRRFAPDVRGDARALDALAVHIAEFSLGGIRAVGAVTVEPGA